MTAVTAKLAEQILSLPCQERIYLVEQLLSSLNGPTQLEIAQLWAQEAERRLDELETGVVKELPGDEVISEMRRRLGR